MKKFLAAISIIFLMLIMTACDTDKAAILFNRDPINEETVLNNTTIFERNERIYYLINAENCAFKIHLHSGN